MTGTLNQIKPSTLTARAAHLVDEAFPALDYAEKAAAVRGWSAERSAIVGAAIGAAYAYDVLNFSNVADLARAFEVDLRESWQVDEAFLKRFGKDELKFIAQECGLIEHMGTKPFSKLFGSKVPDLIAGMLNATGFDWAGHLPSAMTLDGKYSPPAAA